MNLTMIAALGGKRRGGAAPAVPGKVLTNVAGTVAYTTLDGSKTYIIPASY